MPLPLAVLLTHGALVPAAGRVIVAHPFGMSRGFLALALLFAAVFAIMVLIGHLAHRGDDRRR